jgi:hypothetical protein
LLGLVESHGFDFKESAEVIDKHKSEMHEL